MMKRICWGGGNLNTPSYRFVLLLILLLNLVVGACKPQAVETVAVIPGTPAPTSTPDPVILLAEPQGIQAELQEDAHLLTDETLRAIDSYDSKTGEIIISTDAPGVDEIEEGQVLVGGISLKTPVGLLRRVVSIDRTADSVGASGKLAVPQLLKLHIHTEQASLQDLFVQAEVRDKKKLTYNDIDFELTSSAGVKFDTDSGRIYLPVSKTITDKTTDATATIYGHVFIEPKFDFALIYRMETLQAVRIMNETTLEGHVELSAGWGFEVGNEVLVECITFQPQIAWVKVPLMPIPIPVVYQPVIGIYVGADGKFSTQVSVSATHTVTYIRGLVFDGNHLYGIEPPPQRTSTFDKPDLAVDFTAKAYIKPNFKIVLYGVLGLYVEAEVYVRLVVDPLTVPWWELYGGANAEAGIEFEVLGDILPSYEHVLINKEWPLKKATEPPPPINQARASATTYTKMIETSTASISAQFTNTQIPSPTQTQTQTPAPTRTFTPSPTQIPTATRTPPALEHSNLPNLRQLIVLTGIPIGSAIAWKPDSSGLAYLTGQPCTLFFWEVQTGKYYPLYDFCVDDFAWSPDGQRIALNHNGWQLLDGSTGNVLEQLDDVAEKFDCHVDWSSDGRFLALGCDTSLYMWDVEKSTVVSGAGVKYGILHLAWAPSGRRLVVNGAGDKIWFPMTGETVVIHDWRYEIPGNLAWSPNGSILASGIQINSYLGKLTAEAMGKSMTEEVILWSASTGQIVNSLRDQGGGVSYVTWSPDGKYIAAGYIDGAIKIWDVEKGSVITTLSEHQGKVVDIAWSPDGRLIASSSTDGSIRIWGAP